MSRVHSYSWLQMSGQLPPSPHTAPGSSQFLGGLVEPVHHAVHGGHGLYHVVERLVPGLLGEDDQNASLLIQNTKELLVKNHLRELLLHLRLGQTNLARHVVDLNFAVRFNNPAEIVFEHVAVESVEMFGHYHVILQLHLVGLHGSLEVGKTPSFGSKSHCLHGLHVWSRMPECELARHQVCNLIGKIEHHLREKHVFQGLGGHNILNAVILLEGLEKIRES